MRVRARVCACVSVCVRTCICACVRVYDINLLNGKTALRRPVIHNLSLWRSSRHVTSATRHLHSLTDTTPTEYTTPPQRNTRLTRNCPRRAAPDTPPSRIAIRSPFPQVAHQYGTGSRPPAIVPGIGGSRDVRRRRCAR